MSARARSLLADLRRRHVSVEAHEDKLRIDAPRGELTEEERRTLLELKPELLATLLQERSILDRTIEEFERDQDAVGIEVRVRWLPETLWWVPRHAHALDLMRQGVARGRIWTGRELGGLLRVEGVRQDLRGLARLKHAFNLELLDVVRDGRGVP